MDEKIKNLHLPAHLEEELRRAAAKPSWESRNEGVHERVNFDDTIWGFHLAGGAYYNTPLRVTHVRDGSRAEHAGIKPGDVLQRINGLDSSTITLEKAHDMILDSGIHIKLEVCAPDVEETSYYVYEDEIEARKRKEKEKPVSKPKKIHGKFNGARTNDAWSLAWPCNKKRDITYRESNCFMVPSKFEALHLSAKLYKAQPIEKPEPIQIEENQEQVIKEA